MRISNIKKDKIAEQILYLLFSVSPRSLFTSNIALELARDEEFTKKLLFELKDKNLLKEIKKSPKGDIYSKRSRWQITDKVYEIYKKKS